MKKLGFGFMRLPLLNPEDQSSIDFPQLSKMVDAFLEKGFSYFDTAYMYHNFTSELALKQVLTSRYPRSSYVLADKMPIELVTDTAQQEAIFQQQLQKCGVDYFDVYLAHNLGGDNYKKAQTLDTFGFFRAKKQAGLIKKIGFSFHDSAELLDKILTEHPETDLVQLQINYLDWDNDCIQSGKCYQVARLHGKQVIVMEPVKGGTLVEVPEAAGQLFKNYHAQASNASWAIRFAASLDDVFVVLSGMSNLEQVQDNVGYMDEFVPLTADERMILDQAAQIILAEAAIACTSCQYCVSSCPQRIPIPMYFTLYNNRIRTANKGMAIQQVYYNNLARKMGKASDCVQCGVCEPHCPQHLAIRRYLEDVAALFEAQSP